MVYYAHINFYSEFTLVNIYTNDFIDNVQPEKVAV